MHDIFSREPDPIEGMLHPPSPADNEALRQEVYTQTRRAFHHRRRWRQLAYAAALLLSFAAGAGVMRLSLPDRSGSKEPSQPIANSKLPAVEGVPSLREGMANAPALAVEWRAFDSDDQRGELYRQAGDRYMTEENDPQSALRCYSNALDNGNEHDLAISTNDNWLLMAIKDARQRERNNAKQGS